MSKETDDQEHETTPANVPPQLKEAIGRLALEGRIIMPGDEADEGLHGEVILDAEKGASFGYLNNALSKLLPKGSLNVDEEEKSIVIPEDKFNQSFLRR